MNCSQFVTSITAIAVAIAQDKSEQELLLLSSIFMQIGDTLATISARRALCEDLNILENKK